MLDQKSSDYKKAQADKDFGDHSFDKACCSSPDRETGCKLCGNIVCWFHGITGSGHRH